MPLRFFDLSDTLFNDVEGFIHFFFGDGERRGQGNDIPHGQFKTEAFCQSGIHHRLGLITGPLTRCLISDQLDS